MNTASLPSGMAGAKKTALSHFPKWLPQNCAARMCPPARRPAVRNPLGFQEPGATGGPPIAKTGDGGWGMGRWEKKPDGMEGGRRNSGGTPGPLNRWNPSVLLSQDTGNEKAAPPEVDGSRLLWYAIGDLRAALAGVDRGPLSVLWPPLRAFLFGKGDYLCRLKSPAIGLRPAVGLRRPGASAQADARHSVPRKADFQSAHAAGQSGR